MYTARRALGFSYVWSSHVPGSRWGINRFYYGRQSCSCSAPENLVSRGSYGRPILLRVSTLIFHARDETSHSSNLRRSRPQCQKAWMRSDLSLNPSEQHDYYRTESRSYPNADIIRFSRFVQQNCNGNT